jgi:hypothetical protein
MGDRKDVPLMARGARGKVLTPSVRDHTLGR